MIWCAKHRAGESAEEDTCEVAAVWSNATPYGSGPCDMVEALLIVKEPDGSWPTADLEATLIEQGVLTSEMYVTGFRHQDKIWRYVSDWREVTEPEIVNDE